MELLLYTISKVKLLEDILMPQPIVRNRPITKYIEKSPD